MIDIKHQFTQRDNDTAKWKRLWLAPTKQASIECFILPSNYLWRKKCFGILFCIIVYTYFVSAKQYQKELDVLKVRKRFSFFLFVFIFNRLLFVSMSTVVGYFEFVRYIIHNCFGEDFPYAQQTSLYNFIIYLVSFF